MSSLPCAVLLAAITMIYGAPGPNTVHGDAVPPWEGAGVYVFGGYVVDMTKRIEKWIPSTLVGIVDCSDGDYFCASSRKTQPVLGRLNLIVPRWCRTFAIGDQWSKDGVSTEVLAIIHPVQHPLELHFSKPQTIYLLGSSQYPQIVYEYWPNDGVVGIYDSLGKADFVAIAQRTGTLADYDKAPFKESRVTLDRFAGCNSKPRA